MICRPAHPVSSLVRKVDVERQVFSVRPTAAVSSLSNRRTFMSLNVPEIFKLFDHVPSSKIFYITAQHISIFVFVYK